MIQTQQELIDIIYTEWVSLKQFIKQNEFNDIEYKKRFDDLAYETLMHFTGLCLLHSTKKDNNDIAYIEQIKSIAETIDKRKSISYKQFRVLCFFWIRIQYRITNPIKTMNNK